MARLLDPVGMKALAQGLWLPRPLGASFLWQEERDLPAARRVASCRWVSSAFLPPPFLLTVSCCHSPGPGTRPTPGAERGPKVPGPFHFPTSGLALTWLRVLCSCWSRSPGPILSACISSLVGQTGRHLCFPKPELLASDSLPTRGKEKEG